MDKIKEEKELRNAINEFLKKVGEKSVQSKNSY